MIKKGVVLIFSFFVIVVLTVLAAALLTKSIAENSLTQRHVNSTRAFWLAEEGIAESLKNLTATSVSGCLTQARGCPQGYTCCYSATIDSPTNNYYPIQSVGTVTLPSGATSVKTVDAVAFFQLPSPTGFDNAIEISGELVTKGQAYDIDGTIEENATLDFSVFFGQSEEDMEASATVYEDAISGAVEGITWVNVTPETIMTVAGDLQGSGILIVSGDVYFSGTVNFDGILYVIGALRMSGTPTITGTIIAESGADIDTTISGNVTIDYDTDAISEALAQLPGVSPQIVSWRQSQ